MAGSVNRTIIVGNLGKDPEKRVMPSGDNFVSFSVATTESWKDKSSGERKEKTEWHNMVVFGKLAEIIAQYLKKGSKAYFEGKLQTRKYQDKSGNERYTTEIVVNEMHMLDSKGEGGQSSGSQSRQQSVPEPPADFDDDSDIPF